MVARNGLLRVFWPSDLQKDEGAGIIVGWRNSDLDIFVVSILKGLEVDRNIPSIVHSKVLTFRVGS